MESLHKNQGWWKMVMGLNTHLSKILIPQWYHETQCGYNYNMRHSTTWIFCDAKSLTLILKQHVVRNYGLYQGRSLIAWLVQQCKLTENCMESNLWVTIVIRLYLQLYLTQLLNLAEKIQIFGL